MRYTDKEKMNEKVKELVKDIQQEKILKVLSEMETNIDDLSQSCCYAAYEIEDTLHDLQLSVDKIKENVK